MKIIITRSPNLGEILEFLLHLSDEDLGVEGIYRKHLNYSLIIGKNYAISR